jgi:hypothetical protein
MVEPHELLTTAEAARLLGVTRSRVVELAASVPDFPHWQPAAEGGRVWHRREIEGWVAAHPDRGPLHFSPELPKVGLFAPDVHRILKIAIAEARILSHPGVSPEHLLIALVHPDCPGMARAVLRSFGVTQESLQQARAGSMVDPFEPGTGAVSPTPITRSVLERAHLEAALLGDADASSEHVLLALVSHWGDSPSAVVSLRRRGMDPAAVRHRVLDLTEAVLVPPPTSDRPDLKGWAEVAPGLDLAPTQDGKDPRRRMPWGSMVFVDTNGKPLRLADGRLRQYLVDRDGHPVLTADGRPVHLAHDQQGQWVLDEDGRPVVVAVEVPEGSALRPGRVNGSIGEGGKEDATK